MIMLRFIVAFFFSFPARNRFWNHSRNRKVGTRTAKFSTGSTTLHKTFETLLFQYQPASGRHFFLPFPILTQPLYHFSSLDNEFNYRIFHFIGYFIWEKFSSILIFAQNGEKNLGIITPLLSFFSIYCTKKFSVYSRDKDSNEDSKTTVNYKNFRFQGRFIRENIQVFWHFCKMVKKIWPSKAGTKQKFQFGSEFL